MNFQIIKAIFKRNFVSYFSNPTGYVFICVFVFLSSVAAFWPNEFFNSNLANLDQLTKYLPIIMLVFIPAITMGIWADERRQGTDELLLTIPATDFDVVLGKYLAAVAIFSVSLVFSLLCNFAILMQLGRPDVGLFLGTYFGYWMVGLAMLAIGMTASFLTGNLPISFILGALFNAPLVLAGSAESVPWPQWLTNAQPELVTHIKGLSFGEQLRDFSRGVITMSGVAYFLTIAALMLYVSMVLIGRRHWRGGREGNQLATHYWARFFALVLVVIGLNLFFERHDRLRADITSEQLSSLSAKTRQLLQEINPKYPIHIQAYISKTVPEGYVPTRLNLISALREFEALGGDKIKVDIKSEMELFSDDAQRADQQYGIRPQTVVSYNHGAATPEPIFLGAAITCGLEKKVVPFFDKGLPVEYELIRSVAVVAQQKQKKVGVLITDAKLFGGFDFGSRSMTNNQLIIDELKKQYEVSQVDATQPIKEKFDVLLAVQPSSLSPEQMEHFIAAIRAGQPTAIFEDPMPFFVRDSVPGTAAPRMPPQSQMMFMQQPPAPKGDINKLWNLLQVKFKGDSVVWQKYNPYPRFQGSITPEWVFIGEGEGNKQAFNKDSSISADMQLLLFPFPGAITDNHIEKSPLKFQGLCFTGEQTGTVACDQLFERSFMGMRMNPDRSVLRKTGDKYVLAAHIHGKLSAKSLLMSDKEPEESAPKESEHKEDADHDHDHAHEAPKAPAATGSGDSELSRILGKGTGEAAAGDGEINVVLVADMDCLLSAFFELRAQGQEREEDSIVVDNVPFVLNVLDVLADDPRFIEIRTRRLKHRTLETVTEVSKEWTNNVSDSVQKVKDQLSATSQKLEQRRDQKVAELQKDTQKSRREKQEALELVQKDAEQEIKKELAKQQRALTEAYTKAERDLSYKIHQLQDGYKLKAVLLPPIPPLIVAFLVYFNRRSKEREGVSKARLR